MIAMREAYGAGLLQRSHWLGNIIAGIIVGVVALPLSMAFAIASGAKPEQGIYTAIVAGVVVSIFGGTRVQIAGPTGAFIAILAGITVQYGMDGLQIATLLAGFILVIMSLLRMGAVIRFIPDPVIVGFTSGIAVIIWVGQWKDFFGLPAVGGEHFHQKLWHLLQVLPHWHIATTALAVFSLLLVIYSQKCPGLKRVPGPLIALLAATVLQAVFNFKGVATIGTAFGGIPYGLPAFHWPELTLSRVIELIGPAFAIAMLGAIESLLSAVVADGMTGTRHNSNQELLGQGLANILTPLFSGFAATGAIARTATNIRNGGNTPVAGIVHALTLVLVLLLLAPLAVHIPLAVLAAILFVVAWNMSEARHFIRMMKQAPRADVAILLITFLLTVFVDLVVAVNIGVILAIVHFLRRMASSVELQLAGDEQLQEELSEENVSKLPEGVLVYIANGPLFFAAVDNFQRALATTHTEPKVLIIRLRWVPFIDGTALRSLEDVIKNLHKRGVRVLFSGANERVRGKLDKAGITELVGVGNMAKDFHTAVTLCKTLEKEGALWEQSTLPLASGYNSV
ncbi:SulP family inorganic anion transporter [Legionella spiritensis]|uniref:Sulfate transporter n=1 Tax=Legionella spiritensis TaxID=452 RepID=A0A0W0Z819_LEGSP|nr:sulfate transporter [Legionella spiritensis]SNV30198.1 sulfate permease [Legionella spiritensis]